MKRAVLVAIACSAMAALPSCGGGDLTTTGPAVVRPPAGPSAAMFDRLVRSVDAAGFAVTLAQPSRGRFAVRAQYRDVFGGYVFAVECFQDGTVTVQPIGPRVEREAGSWILPARLRDELTYLTGVIRRAAREG